MEGDVVTRLQQGPLQSRRRGGLLSLMMVMGSSARVVALLSRPVTELASRTCKRRLIRLLLQTSSRPLVSSLARRCFSSRSETLPEYISRLVPNHLPMFILIRGSSGLCGFNDLSHVYGPSQTFCISYLRKPRDPQRWSIGSETQPERDFVNDPSQMSPQTPAAFLNILPSSKHSEATSFTFVT